MSSHAAAMLSYAELWLGDIDSAYRLGSDAFERASRVHAADHPTTLWLGFTLAFALIRMGRVEEAHEMSHLTCRRAVEALGADHTITLVAGSVDGLAALRVGELAHLRMVGRATWTGLVRPRGRPPCCARRGHHPLPGCRDHRRSRAVLTGLRVGHVGTLGPDLRCGPPELGERAPVRRSSGSGVGKALKAN